MSIFESDLVCRRLLRGLGLYGLSMYCLLLGELAASTALAQQGRSSSAAIESARTSGSNFNPSGPGYPERASAPPPPEVSNNRSGISFLLDGVNGAAFVEEYLYHNIAIDDSKVVYMRSDTAFYFEHNWRNVIGIPADILSDSRKCPAAPLGSVYCGASGWRGPDGVAGSGDEHRIGLGGADGIPNSRDDGNIVFRIDRFGQYYPYQNIPTTGEPYPINHLVTPGARYTLRQFFYEAGVPVLGTTGSNGAPYGSGLDNTTARYHRGILSPEGNQIHTMMFWDNDYQNLGNYRGRGRLSDGAQVTLVVDPLTPIVRLSAPAGEQFFTTPLVTLHTPVAHTQRSYITAGVVIELLSLQSLQAKAIYFRINNGPTHLYTGLFTLRGLPSGNHTLETWFNSNEPRYKRVFTLDPSSPSAGESRGTLLFGGPAERQRVAARLDRPPFFAQWRRYDNSFLGDLRDRQLPKYREMFPLLTRGAYRDTINLSSVPFRFLVPYHLTSTITPSTNPEYGQIAKMALLSLTSPDLIGAEVRSDSDVYVASSDLLTIPNSGMNEYKFLPLAYDLLKAHFLRDNHSLGATPIEELKIRENLAKLAYSMLKFRDSQGWTVRGEVFPGDNVGDPHHRLGKELIAYLIGAAMPSYESTAYGRSGFANRQLTGYLHTPYPDQRTSWYALLADPHVGAPGYPNNISRAIHFKIFGTFQQILSYQRDPRASWRLPTTGAYWLGPNGFAVIANLSPEGTSVACPQVARHGIALPPTAYNSRFECGEPIWTLDGLKLVSSWDDVRASRLTDGIGPAGFVGAVELVGGYEMASLENLALASMIHARLYGQPLAPNVDSYFDTKMRGILGQRPSEYLVQMGTDPELVTDRNLGTPVLNNRQLIALRMPLGAFHPLVSPLGPQASETIWWFGNYERYWSKVIGPSQLLNMLLFASVAESTNR